MAAQNSGGNDPNGKSRLRRRLLIAISIPMIIWTVIDERYPNLFSRLTKAATIIGNVRFSTIKGPATVKVGSLLVTLPKGEIFTTRYDGSDPKFAIWKPTTNQWADIAKLGYKDLGLTWNDHYYPSAQFIVGPKADAAALTTTCAFRPELRNLGAELEATEPAHKLSSAFRRFRAAAGVELAVPRESKKFLGHDLVFMRIASPLSISPEKTYLQTSLPITRDVNLEFSLMHDDIDAETLWDVIANIEEVIPSVTSSDSLRPRGPRSGM